MTDTTLSYPVLRQTMVDCQIRTFDVTNQGVIERFIQVPREKFVDESLLASVYSDSLITLKGAGKRAMLRPLVHARLVQAANITKEDTVLDVASVSGYSSAILAGLAGKVVALESDADLSARSRTSLDELGFAGVKTVNGPLENGAAAEGPFDVIIINGAIELVPDALKNQLKDGGRLLAIVRGEADNTGRLGKVYRYEKSGNSFSGRPVFDASAPTLGAFKKEEEFVF